MTTNVANADGATIRLARQRDLPGIAEFAETVVHEHYDDQIGVAGANGLLQWWGPTLADAVDAGLVHLAVDGEDIVGLVERGLVDGEPVVWKLYVTAERRNEGVGPRLLAVTTADIEPNHRRVLLEHVSTNHRAARFYEREGFEFLRREPSDDPENDLVWRARPLDVNQCADEYASTAEFHEIHMDATWAELDTVLADTFREVPADGVIVDIGAGSGSGVAALARHTDCEIIAVEPSASMRSMLLVRLAALGLTDRVTVVAGAVPGVLDQLPEQVNGVVGAHMLGHLTNDDRQSTIAWAAEHLVDGGVMLFTISGVATTDPDAVHVEDHRVGRQIYRATHRSPDELTYESLFEVLAGDRVLRACVVTGRWERVTADRLVSQLGDLDVTVTRPRPDVVVLRC